MSPLRNVRREVWRWMAGAGQGVAPREDAGNRTEPAPASHEAGPADFEGAVRMSASTLRDNRGNVIDTETWGRRGPR